MQKKTAVSAGLVVAVLSALAGDGFSTYGRGSELNERIARLEVKVDNLSSEISRLRDSLDRQAQR